MAEFTQAQIDELKALSADGFAHWQATGTEDQIAAGIRMGEELKENPGKHAEVMENMTVGFAAADSN